MKAVVFGSTGMIGQGVVRELLLDSDVERVLTVVRKPTGRHDAKVREIVHDDFHDFSRIAHELVGYDACFFCLGTSSAGMSEADYRRITYDITIAAATALLNKSPGMTFIYISGTGADSSENGRVMWARVRGKLENDLLGMPFGAVYVFRPAVIQPLHGIEARQKWTRVLYKIVGPTFRLWKAVAPSYVTTTEQLGRAMIYVAKHGAPKTVLESRDFHEILGERAKHAHGA